MSQDTRKDPRAKVLTMTVRYKSATVDEFIEHHSYDVSRGGIFIKTPSPFPPGTLLKFEIKIADDKSVLQGVGRVVWKREGPQGTPDNPAGMGVKFIKIDDASKATIDRLVSTQDGPTAFDAETPMEKEEKPVPVPVPAPTPAPAPAALGGGGGFQRKGTMMGLGAVAKAVAADTPAPASPGGGFFPSTPITEAEMPPPAERTVMKQAAELLAEALKEAGGSFDEISDNPLFEAKPAEPKPAAVPASVTTTAKLAPLPSAEEKRPAAVAMPTPETPKRAAEERPLPVAVAAPRGSDPPSRRSSQSLPGPESIPVDKGGGRTLLYMGIVAVIGVGAYFATQMGPAPAPVVPATPVASSVAVATTSAPTPMPVVSETAAPAASVAAPTLSASAGVTASASAKPAAPEVPKTPDTAKPVKTAEVVAPPVKTETVKPPPPARTETPPPVKTESPTPPPPKPPVKKPPAGGDDNPY